MHTYAVLLSLLHADANVNFERRGSTTPGEKMTRKKRPSETQPANDPATQPEKEPLAIRRAREYGIDVDLVRAMLRLTPEERLRTLEETLLALQTAKPTGRRPADSSASATRPEDDADSPRDEDAE